MIQYQSLNNSLISGSPVFPIIDLGLHGFADTFYPKNLSTIASRTAPLICCLDKGTGLVQLQNVTVAEERYNLIDYSYTSSNSQVSRRHWQEFFQSVSRKIPIKHGRILEIGSNDGYLLSLFKKGATQIIGIDASETVVLEANSRGIETIHGIFGESDELNITLKEKISEFDLIIANNVLNHSNNPLKFIKDISCFLKRDGIFVFEVPYWYSTISSFRFDQIYLEHITYFTVESLEHFLKTAGLFIYEVELVDYHGGSLRVHAGFSDRFSKSKDDFLALERKIGLKDENTYIVYMNKVNEIKNRFILNLNQYKKAKPFSKIFGVGAAAKANTLLTYFGLTNQDIHFIIDASPLKQGKITPVSLIPIEKDEIISDLSSGLGIVLAWNLNIQLKKKLIEINKNIEFLDIL